jgi:hypothetical protein
MHWGLVAILFFRNFSRLSIQGAREELSRLLPGRRLKMEKRRRLVAVLDMSEAKWPVGPKARAARLSQHGRWSHTKARRHEGGEMGRNFEFWILDVEWGRWK